MSYKPSELADVKTFTQEQIARANEKHKQLCQFLSEDNMEELKKLAKELGITTNGKKKQDICNEIATTIYYFTDKDTSIYNMENADFY